MSDHELAKKWARRQCANILADNLRSTFREGQGSLLPKAKQGQCLEAMIAIIENLNKDGMTLKERIDFGSNKGELFTDVDNS